MGSATSWEQEGHRFDLQPAQCVKDPALFQLSLGHSYGSDVIPAWEFYMPKGGQKRKKEKKKKNDKLEKELKRTKMKNDRLDEGRNGGVKNGLI